MIDLFRPPNTDEILARASVSSRHLMRDDDEQCSRMTAEEIREAKRRYSEKYRASQSGARLSDIVRERRDNILRYLAVSGAKSEREIAQALGLRLRLLHHDIDALAARGRIVGMAGPEVRFGHAVKVYSIAV